MKLKTILKSKTYQCLLEYDVTVAIMQAMTEINSTDMFKFFKNVTDNYMGLQKSLYYDTYMYTDTYCVKNKLDVHALVS